MRDEASARDGRAMRRCVRARRRTAHAEHVVVCAVLGAIAGALAACKGDRSTPPPLPQPSTPTRPVQHAKPALPAPADPTIPDASVAVVAPPITAEDAALAMPKLAGDVMIAAKATGDGHQVHGTWCLPGTAADAVVHDLATTLTTAGWTSITTRGDATKAGVSGERDGYRLSYIVSASSAASCRAPGHYFASATIFRTIATAPR